MGHIGGRVEWNLRLRNIKHMLRQCRYSAFIKFRQGKKREVISLIRYSAYPVSIIIYD